MSDSKLNVAVVQMVSGMDVDENLEQVANLILPLKSQNLDLIVLPEMFACLGVKNQVALAATRFHKDDVLAQLSKWSQDLNCYVMAGSLPLVDDASPDKVRAAGLLFSPGGEQVARYDKIHLFDVSVADNKGSYRESDTFSPGDKPVVADVAGHKLGMSICYDLRFPELFQHYQLLGCSLMTVPSAFTYKTGQAHWEVLLRARAIETQSFVLAANQGGVHDDGRETWGHSMIVNPRGEVIAEITEAGPGVAVAELDFATLNQVRTDMPLMEHKRL